MLIYDSEAVLPVKVALHKHHLTTFQESLNNTALPEALDLLSSIHGDALIYEALYKLWMAQLHDRVVKAQPLYIGNLVLCRTQTVARSCEHDKLMANWEGPCKVVEQAHPRIYRLTAPQGMPIPRTLHSTNLHKYYV